MGVEIKMSDTLPKIVPPLEGETVLAYRKRVNPVIPEGQPEPLKGELVQDYRRRLYELRFKP